MALAIKFLQLTFIAFIFSGISTLKANVRLPRIFSSNMVLQQGRANPIWGWADKDESVSIEIAGKHIQVKAGTDGYWKASLPVMDYGGPHVLKVRGNNTIEFTNILIGEVWVCSGQSNMGVPVEGANNSATEIASAIYPRIRLFVVAGKLAQFPLQDLEQQGHWVECSPATVKRFTAVGYFFGRDLHKRLNVPVGLISSSVGGTSAEIWTSGTTIQNDPDFKEPLRKLLSIDFKKDKQNKTDSIIKMAGEFPVKDKGLVNGVALYADPALDEQSWKDLKVPAAWNPLIVGIAWSRKKFTLTREQASADIEIHLSRIDDDDSTWLNGQLIGTTVNVQDRTYKVPAGYLKEGENVLAVRIGNRNGTGGMCGVPEDMYVLANKGRISLAGTWKFKIGSMAPNGLDMQKNDYPTILFNAMINPLIPFGIKGVIWYQGENNAGRAAQYHRLFPNLIKDWRTHWRQGDFPFLFVSLANYRPAPLKPAESSWAALREAQASALSLPNTGMALAIDLGDADDLHPKGKQGVGYRLALSALKVAYKKKVIYSGPVFHSMKREGDNAMIRFSDMGSPLVLKDSSRKISGFAVAGADRKFYWAEAALVDKNTIRLHAAEVPNPVAVRYAWADNPGELNLYNKEGLPACPFRTDAW